MSDARISTGLPSHPKTKKLMRRLGAAGPWALVCLFLWARENRSDGDLRGMTDEDIELASDWTGGDSALVTALVAVGFIDGDEGERRIHDWAEHQPWSAGADERSERAKWRALIKHHGRDAAAQRMPEYAARMNASSIQHEDSMLVAEHSMHDGAARSAPSPSPSPSPRSKEESIAPSGARKKKSDRPSSAFDRFWSAYPRGDGKQAALRSWNKLELDGEADTIIADVAARTVRDQKWKDPDFIPYASTYLNQERWRDEWQTKTPAREMSEWELRMAGAV